MKDGPHFLSEPGAQVAKLNGASEPNLASLEEIVALSARFYGIDRPNLEASTRWVPKSITKRSEANSGSVDSD